MIREIRVPHLGFNDQNVTIVDWHKADKDAVRAGEDLCAVETSKTVFTVVAEWDGYVRVAIPADSEVEQLSTIGYIVTSLDENCPEAPARPEKISGGNREAPAARYDTGDDFKANATKKAVKLAAKHDIDISSISKEGVIRERDVIDFIEGHKDMAKIRSKAAAGPKEKIIVLGAGGHAKICIDLVRRLGTFEITGIVDKSGILGPGVFGVPVIGKDADLPRLFSEGIKNAVIGIGEINSPQVRGKFFNELKDIGFKMPNIIHPSAILEKSVRLGEGNQIMAGAVICSNATLQNNCIINTGAIVSHDCLIKNNAHIAPGAILAGSVVVGENALVGMGVTVYVGCNIGKNSKIANGKNVFHDVADDTFVK